MSLFSGQRKWNSPHHNWLQRHSLGVALAVILIAQTAYAIWSGAYVFARESPFGENVKPYESQFWIWWSWEYNVSLVADTFGVLLIVMLSKWLYEQNSDE